ncbi:hypothetical protein RRG08_032688 [Elysia crispata]|uniref:Uncharacterized protein n=1 Tax=Elysia crispata TaxID=231223 RepID=A0AAE0Y0W0_9GAST|nr:hypothetical protein RRG08_032688 [Elysia crispata]
MRPCEVETPFIEAPVAVHGKREISGANQTDVAMGQGGSGKIRPSTPQTLWGGVSRSLQDVPREYHGGRSNPTASGAPHSTTPFEKTKHKN